jgi:H+-translocating NAD(P) transhydrogenase subunit alpha
MNILEYLTVFVLAVFVGFEVISKVPSILHTPLMSGSNAIHGVILVGSMIVLGSVHTVPEEALGFLAVVLATLNVVGGFVVTDRMLEMFKGKAPSGAPAVPAEGSASHTGTSPASGDGSAGVVGSGSAPAAPPTSTPPGSPGAGSGSGSGPEAAGSTGPFGGSPPPGPTASPGPNQS